MLNVIFCLLLGNEAVHAVADRHSGYCAVALPDRIFVWTLRKVFFGNRVLKIHLNIELKPFLILLEALFY